jgi:hypothetical protein
MDKLTGFLSFFPRMVSWLLWRPLEPGEEKSQFNSPRVLIFVGVLAGLFTLYALIAPAPPKYVGEFRETLPPEAQKKIDADREQAIKQATNTAQKAFSNLSGGGNSIGSGQRSGVSANDRNSTMILARPGVNSSNQLAAGMKFSVRLLDKVTISDQAVPVIAEVTHGVFNDSGGGIKEGSRLFGVAQFQNGAEHAQIQFQSISDPSGIVRPIQGVGIGSDGQTGVAGDVHSRSFKNTAGQFVSRFVGAYAEGTEQRDFLGNSRGGATNGLLSAVAATAQDRTNAYAQDLQKEHQWVEIPKSTEITVVLTQTFTFREPGVNQ